MKINDTFSCCFVNSRISNSPWTPFASQEIRCSYGRTVSINTIWIVRVLCKLPQAGDLILSKLVPVTLVGMLILVPVQIHKLGVILVADIVFMA